MSLFCATFASIMSNILYIVLAVCILLVMVLIHELGHYVAGRILKFKITEFSIGFGKAIFSKVNKRGEKISLRIFPLGGYCAFKGEGDDDEEGETSVVEESDKSKVIANEINDIAEGKETQIESIEKVTKKYDPELFNNQKPWKRIIVYLAGVTFNFLSAIIFTFILLVSFGYDIQQVKTFDADYAHLYNISQNADENLQVGDVIRTVNGIKVNFATSGNLPQLLIKADASELVTLGIERNGKDMQVKIKLEEKFETDANNNKVRKVVTGFETQSYKLPFFEALGKSVTTALGFAWIVLKGFWQIITGQVALNQLGGPISTIGMISSATKQSFANIFVMLPLFSANLAIFNAFPIPALDGAHVVFTTIEWIRGKPINRKIEGYIHVFGLLALFAFVIVIDIIHLVTG